MRVETLELLAARNPAWAVDTGPVDGWRPLAELARREVLDEVAEGISSRLGGTTWRVAASTAQLGIAARLWCLTVGAVGLGDACPSLADVRWRHDDGAISLHLSDGPPGDVSEVLALLAGTVTALAPLSEQLLWGNVASALAGFERVLRLPPQDLVRDLLAAPPLAGLMVGPRRTTCCLFWQVPGGGLCGDCVLDAVPVRAS